MSHRAAYEVRVKGGEKITKAEHKPHVAIYTRVSTEEQAAGGFSLEGQVERLRQYCASRDWVVVGTYVDAGHSGREISHREQYQKMIADMAKWDAIVVMKMDRIHRNSKNFLAMMEDLARHEKDFVSITESLDTETAMGRFVMTILSNIAQLESEQIGERTAFGMSAKARTEERVFTGAAPFGYAWSVPSEDPAARALRRGTGELVVDQDEAPVVRRLYELSSKGQGRGSLSQTLGWCTCVPEEIRQDVRKFSCPVCEKVWIARGRGPVGENATRAWIVKHAKRWHEKEIQPEDVLDAGVLVRKAVYRRWDCTGCQRIAYILRNPVYAGFFTWGGKIYPGHHEPIVTREIFDRVQGRRIHLRVVLPDASKPAEEKPRRGKRAK